MKGHPPGTVLKPLVKLGRTPADCWTWLGKIDANGCAVKQFNGSLIPARRWMWMQFFGPIPAGKVIYTACGSRQCTRPHCLRLGTQAEACRATSSTILTEGDVIELRECPYRTPQIAEGYADRFGVSPQAIRDVWRGTTWGKAKLFKAEAARAGDEKCQIAQD